MVDASANAYLELEKEKIGFNLFKASNIKYFQISGDSYQLFTLNGLKTYNKSECLVFQACDTVISTKNGSDYFVLGTFVLCPNEELLLLDIARERLEGSEQIELIIRKHDEYKPLLIGLESSNMGLTLYQQLRNKGLPIVELKPETDKYTRAIPVATKYETGMLYHLEKANWLNDFEAELLSFPNGMYDDQIDVISYGVYMQLWGYLNRKSKRSRVLVLG